MHIRKSSLAILSLIGVLFTIILLVSTGWVQSSSVLDWKLQQHWNSWKGNLPFGGGSKLTNSTGTIVEGAPIADETEITPDIPVKGSPFLNYTDISIKDESLRKRLSELLSRPIRAHKEALELNAQTCPIEVADKQVSTKGLCQVGHHGCSCQHRSTETSLMGTARFGNVSQLTRFPNDGRP
jgi:hypothetical protein